MSQHMAGGGSRYCWHSTQLIDYCKVNESTADTAWKIQQMIMYNCSLHVNILQMQHEDLKLIHYDNV